MIIKTRMEDVGRDIFINTENIQWVIDMNEYFEIIMMDGTNLSVDPTDEIVSFLSNKEVINENT